MVSQQDHPEDLPSTSLKLDSEQRKTLVVKNISNPIFAPKLTEKPGRSQAGMLNMKIQDRLRDGYTPTTSMSRYEADVYREFLGIENDPVVTLVMFRAKDGGSIHRLEHLNEIVKWHRFIRSYFSFEYNESGKEPQMLTYEDFCGAFCGANVAIEYFAETLKDEIKRLDSNKTKSSNVNISYPITTVRGYELHLERNFYGVKLKEDNEITDLEPDEELLKLKSVTPIRFIEAALLLFRGDGDERKMAQWEMALHKFGQETFSSNLLDITMFGMEIIDYEMKQHSPTPYFAIGFISMLIFVFVNVLLTSYFYGVLDKAKILLILVATLCPVLAITSTFGILSLLHMRTNTVMLIMPFLIMGIGVDDTFLMTHSWYRTAKHRVSVIERLALTFEEIGPSITITTFTNVLTFFIGSFTPTPEIQIFCAATAIALGLTYVYCLILFGPVMYFASFYEQKHELEQSRGAEKMKTAMFTVCKGYSQLLQHKIVALFLGLVLLGYWYFAALGTLTINSKLDPEKLLPHNSSIREADHIMTRLVYYEYYPITVLINNPLDIRKTKDLHNFENMLGEFESMKWCRGKELTILWLRDYIQYVNTYEDFDYYSDDSEPKISLVQENSTETGLDYKRLKEFLASPIYRHYKQLMNLNDSDPDVPLSRFMFIIANHNTTNWDDRIEIVQQSRAIAVKYPELNVTIWEANSMFVDQMLSLKMLTLMTCLMTLGCMAIVCAIFIRNLMAVVVATCAIFSVSLGVIGYLSWWDMDLDPATMCAILMSIGMSVDFTAHMAYKFQLNEYKKIQNGKIIHVPLQTQQDKLVHAIKSVGWPLLQGGISTVITILPLAHQKDYIPMVFVKTITLVVILGLGHGMVLLPAFMVLLPQNWFGNGYKPVSNRSIASNMNKTAEAEIHIKELQKDII